ncbi:MAG TPA: type VI secretion IcmF C-terminal domain-containing protein, partial [Casimicrobium sp.]|nr:type VI secretion IcmF C-terminal domain-containing protein [Casimicrobium sp.]
VGATCSTSINGRYPFVRSAQQEVLPNDFAQVFAPGAGMDDFFQKNLAQFVDTSKNPWAPRQGSDGAAAGSPADLAQFQRARDISTAFFAGGSRTPSFEVEARVSSSGADKIELDVDGQVVSSQDSSKRVSWPGPKKSNQVKLTVGAGRPLTTEGNWALHRLIDRGTAQSGNAPERVVVVVNVDGRDVTLDFRAMSVRNPLRLPAMQSFSCPGRS